MWYAWWSCRSRYSTSSEASIVPCTVPLSSKWNWRSVCTTPHYIPQRKRRKNKMKWDPAGTSTQSATPVFLWFCHTGRGRKGESEDVSHLCYTQRSGWFEVVCFVSSTSLHVRHQTAADLPVRPFYLFIFLSASPIPPPSSSLLNLTSSGSLYPVYSWLSFLSLHLLSLRHPALSSLCAPSLWPSVSPSSSLLGWRCGKLMNPCASDSLACEWTWCG